MSVMATCFLIMGGECRARPVQGLNPTSVDASRTEAVQQRHTSAPHMGRPKRHFAKRPDFQVCATAAGRLPRLSEHGHDATMLADMVTKQVAP
ncbi:hypothetical protein AQJ27_47370 [Streptomyces olivochromogenes]|nr:hypothetical protein AQJ27_47370 [Streptomyces olivochromogenes]